MKVAFAGATRGMGRALARLLAERGHDLFLLGRDEQQLARSAADLAVRSGRAVGHAALDLSAPETFAPALEAADAGLGGFDTLVITAAEFATQDALEGDLGRTRRLLDADFTGTVLLCEAARPRLLERRGTLCVFGSVAGDRGRSPIVLYGAAKAGLAHYLEGLDHRYRLRGLRVVTVKPGFVRTAMTQGLPEPPFAADADTAARHALRALERGAPVAYAPPVWGVLMAVIRRLPRAVMRRLRF